MISVVVHPATISLAFIYFGMVASVYLDSGFVTCTG
jgi:hypothetical protein